MGTYLLSLGADGKVFEMIPLKATAGFKGLEEPSITIFLGMFYCLCIFVEIFS